MKLNIDASVFADVYLPYIDDFSHRWEVYRGSAGSGKSYFICQKLIYRCLKEPNLRVLCTRRYGTTLRNSVFALLLEILQKWKIVDFVKINKSDMRITFPNKSEIILMGLDNEEKLLSIQNISVIFVEEVWEVTESVLEQLNLRLRGDSKHLQIMMAFNPISKQHWLYDFCENNPPNNMLYLVTTYKDNPWLPQSYIDSLEELKTRNPQKARVYVYGEWGVNPEGLVLQNWREEEFDIQEIAQRYEHRSGCDFGWSDPTTVVEIFWDEESKRIYVSQEFYKRGQTVEQISVGIKNMRMGKVKTMCDSAEPRTIKQLQDYGINARPCVKGKDSVEQGIRFLQDCEIVVRPECREVINELSNFSYIKDKQTGAYTEKMTHEYSHSIDAIRYALADIYVRGKMQTISKSSFF